MKILIPTQGKGGLEDVVSPVFARAPTFTLVEVENKEIKSTQVLENPSASAFGGAGIQAAQFAAEKGVNVIITGNIGPNASMVLQQTGIEVVSGYGGVRVKDAIDKYLKGSTPPSFQPAYQSTPQPTYQSIKPYPVTQPELSKADLEFQLHMLQLQKQMIEEQIKYIDKKLKELEK